MALISCPSCGKQLSDKATACPHCGAARTATPTPTPSPAAQQPEGSGKKIAIGIAAVALIVAIVVFAGSSEKKPKGTIRDDPTGLLVNGQSAAEQYGWEDGASFGNDDLGSEVRLYNIEINVECIENIRKNKYDVDILVDGEQVDTLKHGQSTRIYGPLPEGFHEVEFRLNEQTADVNSSYDESSITSVTKTIHLSQNETFSFSIKMTWEGITVS